MSMSKEDIVKAIAEAAQSQSTEAAAKAVAAVNEYLTARFGAAAAVSGFEGVGTQFAKALKGDPRLVLMAQKRGMVAGTDPIAVKIPRYGLKDGEYSPALYGKATVVTGDFPAERTYLPLVDVPRRRVFLRDIIPVAGLGTPQIEYARIIGCDNSAGGVAEGAAKPESGLDTELKVEAVKQIATWIPVSRQSVRDVTGLAAFLNNILAYFLAIEEDDQILNGAGGNDMNGILNDPGIQSQAVGAEASPAQPKLIAVRKAITKVQTGLACFSAGFDPTALVVHPNDAEDLDLLTDTTGRYMLTPFEGAGGQAAAGGKLVWGLPVVVTPAIAAGTGLVGAFDMGATLWTYDDVTLRISDSHSDFFVKNLLAVLAEMRELLVIYYPKGFCKVTGL